MSDSSDSDPDEPPPPPERPISNVDTSDGLSDGGSDGLSDGGVERSVAEMHGVITDRRKAENHAAAIIVQCAFRCSMAKHVLLRHLMAVSSSVSVPVSVVSPERESGRTVEEHDRSKATVVSASEGARRTPTMPNITQHTDERRVLAAVKLQCAYRCHQSRCIAISLLSDQMLRRKANAVSHKRRLQQQQQQRDEQQRAALAAHVEAARCAAGILPDADELSLRSDSSRPAPTAPMPDDRLLRDNNKHDVRKGRIMWHPGDDRLNPNDGNAPPINPSAVLQRGAAGSTRTMTPSSDVGSEDMEFEEITALRLLARRGGTTEQGAAAKAVHGARTRKPWWKQCCRTMAYTVCCCWLWAAMSG